MDIPLIDCDPGTHSEAEIAAQVDRALASAGFMALARLGLAPETVDAAFAAARRFFALPDDEKQRCAYGAAAENFGYQGIGQESLDPSAPVDLKEAFTMRNLLAAPIPAPRWPDARFRHDMTVFYQDAMACAVRLQRILALALDVPRDYFVERHGGENVTLRLLHYPPVDHDRVAAAQMGAGAHTDYGMLTLLLQDDVGGLQVQSAEGLWLDVPPRPGAIVINAGDLLERWSNGRYRSTRHRVLPQPRGRERYSIALFVDPDSDVVVDALPSCTSAGQPPRWPPITAGAHLQEKIEATHLAG